MSTIRIDLGRGMYALADAADAEALSSHKWTAQKSSGSNLVYAVCKQDGRRIFMHRYLLSPRSDLSVDHVNGDGLDNRRENIRICSHAENMRNRRHSRRAACAYKGVCRNRRKYRAQIRHEGVKYHLGVFDDQESAAKAYDIAAIRLHGEFARTNFKNVSHTKNFP